MEEQIMKAASGLSPGGSVNQTTPADFKGQGSNPTGGGDLPNGATEPATSASMARNGMGSGSEMPVMARGTPPLARIASGDLRRGGEPTGGQVARPPSGGPPRMASIARKGGYLKPMNPKGATQG